MLPYFIIRPWPWMGDLTLFDVVIKMLYLFFMIECCDKYCLRIKQFLDTRTHEVINTLYVHFPNQSFLNAVDHRQLCLSLFGFLKQPAGFIKQSGVFKRHAHAVGNCFE